MIDFNLIFSFLQDLTVHNDREWFKENKDAYNSAADEFKKLTGIMLNKISSFDNTISGLEPKDCIFRINRDTRFSNDKTPYKTNFGCFLAPGGRNSGKAGYYLHLEQDNSLLAGGIYLPPAETLYKVRNRIYNHAEEFASIISDTDFVNNFKGIEGEMLKRNPRDFPADFKYSMFLRYKSYSVMYNLKTEHFDQKNFIEYFEKVFLIMKPFIDFINLAL